MGVGEAEDERNDREGRRVREREGGGEGGASAKALTVTMPYLDLDGSHRMGVLQQTRMRTLPIQPAISKRVPIRRWFAHLRAQL
eukprot:872572-Pyramimonas_sp.AAC.1